MRTVRCYNFLIKTTRVLGLALVVAACGSLLAQPADRARTESLARRAGDRLQTLQQEAERLATEERTLLGELRKLEVEREIKTEQLHQIAARADTAARDGVNFGSLGFLTEVTLPELYPALETAVTGQASIEERLILRSTTTRAGQVFADLIAVNDVVVTKTARSRMIDLSVCVGEQFVTRVKADGLIIATPTGSTAYNLSAGGPIVQPDVEALLLTPIAPHTLTNRPIVIPATSVVRVTPNMEERDEVFATFDGQAGFQLQAGDEISVRSADKPLRLITPTTRSYFEVLRTKLKWGER